MLFYHNPYENVGEIGNIGAFSHLGKGKVQNVDIICTLFSALYVC